MFGRRDRKSHPSVLDLAEQAKETVWPPNLKMPLPPVNRGEVLVGVVPESARGFFFLSILSQKKAEEYIVKLKWLADGEEKDALRAQLEQTSHTIKTLREMAWLDTKNHLLRESEGRPVPGNLKLCANMQIVEIPDNGRDDGMNEIFSGLFGGRIPEELLDLLHA